jgi:transcriptional regulator with XRE-family HTH domain
MDTRTTHPGMNLRRLRLARGLSLRDVASVVGVTHAYISNIERGTMVPSAARLAQIAMLLNNREHRWTKRKDRRKRKLNGKKTKEK